MAIKKIIMVPVEVEMEQRGEKKEYCVMGFGYPTLETVRSLIDKNTGEQKIVTPERRTYQVKGTIYGFKNLGESEEAAEARIILDAEMLGNSGPSRLHLDIVK